MKRALAVFTMMSAAFAAPAFGVSFYLGDVNPVATQTANYHDGFVDNFHFSITTGNWVQIDFLGMPDPGADLENVNFSLHDSLSNVLASWSGFNVFDYSRSYTYSGLSTGEDYFVYVDGQADSAVGTGSYSMTFTAQSVAAVPEPETYALLLAGLGLLGFVARHRKQDSGATSADLSGAIG